MEATPEVRGSVFKPGLVLLPSEDPFLSDTGAANAARQAGASIEKLEGIGHWWMLQDPAQGARVLESFCPSLN